MNQNEAVKLTLEKLGGVATLGQLYLEVFKIKNCSWKTKTPFASIRRIVQLDKDIYKIRPGLYALDKYKKYLEHKGIFQETNKHKKQGQESVFNHTYYQGIIATIGNMKSFNTFIPKQDKNKKFILDRLGDVSTYEDLPQFSYPDIVKRSSTIDVIWFNSRKMPHSFFEIEHSTDIQNSLLKFYDLQDFNCRMFIVADKMRKNEFDSKIKKEVYKEISDRVNFLDYDKIIKQYENISETIKYNLNL
ncbi:MAG TPA: hypothetical protein PK447_06365 [Ignavibacteria bacterium]|nr:hypothetical protein [Ignavibacteria bacterium]